ANAPKVPIVDVLSYQMPSAYRYGTSNCTDPAPNGGPVNNSGWCYMVADLSQVRLADNDAARRVVDFGHDPTYGDLTSITQRYNADGSASANDRTTNLTYYTQGPLKTIDGPRTDVSDVTTYGDTTDGTYGGYDRTGQPGKLTDALN